MASNPDDYLSLLPYCTSGKQRDAIQALAESKTQADAAASLGVGLRQLERMIARIRSNSQKMGVSTYQKFTDKDGNVFSQWMKARPNGQDETHQGLKEFADEFCKPYKGKIKPIKPPKSFASDLLTCIFIGDPHLGMLAWGKMTGHENFDTDIAERELTAAIIHMIDQAPPSAVLIINQKGDLFHCDGDRPFTPASGHLLDCDGRFSHTFRAAARIFRKAIDYALKKFPRVVLMGDRGNHDETTSVLFNILMQNIYENEPRVEIPDNEVKMRFYKWGKVGLWFDHSHKAPAKRLLAQIVSQFARQWGETIYRYAHFGHLHHTHTFKNDMGIKAEWHATLAPPDLHHADAAYGNAPSITSVSYHSEYGEDVRYIAPLARIRAGMAA